MMSDEDTPNEPVQPSEPPPPKDVAPDPQVPEKFDTETVEADRLDLPSKRADDPRR